MSVEEVRRMERLTIPDVRVDEHTTRRTMIDARAVKKSAMDFYWRLKAYEDTERTPEEIDMDHEAAEQLRHLCRNCALDRLEKLAEADRDGRLGVLPCKVDDTVWVTRNPWTGKLLKNPLDAYVNGMKMYSHGLYVNLLFDTREINGTRDYEINHIGKTVFLTREEAEKALEAMKNE